MILQKNYNRDKFIDFITEFLPGINIDEREIKIADTKSSDIKSAHLLGESKELDLKVFEIKHTGTSKRRVGLTMEGFQIMRSSGAFRALIAFYSETDKQWRFSLMTLTPKRNEKAKLTIERSSPKRYSFVLGPNSKTATPEKFLISKGTVSDFEDLQSRFSLEVVNKDFYKKISELFTKLVGGTIGNGKGKIEYEPRLKLPSIQDKSQTSLEFAVRLIGRVIFCWFLREKKSKDEISLMPLSLLSYEAVNTNGNYYHSVLEPIFFEVLNKPIKERKEKFTQNGFNSIPYLNGGLFTPHYDDFFHYNEGKQAIFNNTVKVPDTWLQEFFEFLETYNFTIDENISFDEELSIDPEMLGRIFENLLAEINPETGESARKSTGSYYTPRTIVDYMVDESLYAYLDNKTDIDEEKIRAVISYDLGDDAEYPLTEEEQRNITEALHYIKILDPACGSGAFPMGMLQKIVFILQQTDPDGKNWFKKQIQHASPEIRRAIEREFENKNFDYIRKLGIIRENIFGVDIQPIATEISRLRCFLTLIVDESIDDNAENRGIEPLPNLDFKFVTANTLIGLPQSAQSQQQANLFEDDAGIAELQELRDMFFNSTGAERDKLKFEFVQVQKRMLDHLIQSSIRGHAELTSKLTTWDPFSHQASSWFDPEWMFGIKEGFDVVIANPPYVFTRDVDFGLDFKEYVNNNFIKDISLTKRSKSRQAGKINLFAIFLLRGKRLLTQYGNLMFILPNNILRATVYDVIRFELLTNNKIKTIVDLGSGIFENVTASTVLLQLELKNNCHDSKTKIITDINNLISGEYIKRYIDQNNFLYNTSYTFNIMLNEVELELSNKIKNNKKLFGSYCVDIIEGIVAHKNLIRDEHVEGTVELLEGKDIKRFSIIGASNYLIWNKDEIHRTRPDYLWNAEEKIILQRISGGKKPLVAAIDTNKRKTFASVNNIILKNEYKNYYNFFTALLNSSLINWFYANNFSNKSNLTVNISKTYLEAIPIPEISEKQLVEINSYVDEIRNIASDVDYECRKPPEKQLKIERMIDNLVYALYRLTDEEIKIVEDFFVK